MLMQPNGTLGVIYYACRFHKFSSWAKTKRSRDFSLIPLIGLVPSFGIVLVLCNQRASNHWSDRWKLCFWYVCPLNAPNVFFIILKPHQHFLTSTETSQPNSISCVMNSLSSLSSGRASWCLPLRKAVAFSFHLIARKWSWLTSNSALPFFPLLLHRVPLSFSYSLPFWTPCPKHSASWSR